jgi:hypothetical protein
MLRRCVEMPRTVSIPKRPPCPDASGRADGDGADRPLQCTPLLHRRAGCRRPRCGPPRAGPDPSSRRGRRVRGYGALRTDAAPLAHFVATKTNEPQKITTGTTSLRSGRSPGYPRSGGLRQRFILIASPLHRLIRRTAQGRDVMTLHRRAHGLSQPPSRPFPHALLFPYRTARGQANGSFRPTPAWTKATCQPR